MKIIFKIARAELRHLFYSPIAWVVIVVFFVITGMQFVSQLNEMARMQEVTMENSPGFEGFADGLTLKMFLGSIGNALSYFYLFIPLLTMGVISREHNTGTMKLLFSSPLRVRELVLGKYLGLLTFNLILLSGIGLLLLTGALTIRDADYPIYLSSLLGFFLLSGTYLAIGIFISSLTQYQIMAGIITYLVFGILGMVQNWGQEYDLIRDLTYFLSLSDRVEYMIVGLITSRNVLYYLLIIALFIGFTMIRLRSLQESRKWTVSFSRYLLLSVVILFLGYFTSKPGNVAYWDVTRHNDNTIDSTMQEVLKELDGSPVTVTLYTNLLDEKFREGLPSARNKYLWGFWEKYLRFYPNMKFNFEYYHKLGNDNIRFRNMYPGRTEDQIVDLLVRTYGLKRSLFKPCKEIENKIDLSGEPSGLLMELEYKGKKTILRTFAKSRNIWPTQMNVAGAIRKLLRDSIPRILFSVGHFERSPWKFGEREYALHTAYKGSDNALVNTGVQLDSIALTHQAPVPGADLLVIADPKSSLSTVEQEKVMDFLNQGGNALFYAEPGKEALLNTILNRIGVNIESGVLMDHNIETSPVDVRNALNAAGNAMAREKEMQRYALNIKGHTAAGLFFSAAELSWRVLDGFDIEPISIFKGNQKVWLEKGYQGLDSALATFSEAEGDIMKDAYPMALKLSRKINGKEQRIVVVADADFMSLKNFSGFTIGLGLYSWLMNNEYPVYVTEHFKTDRFLTIGKKSGNWIYNAYVYILPGILLLTGLILVIRRSRK